MVQMADSKLPQNHYAFSPSPWFIAVFFSGQTLLQAYWIRQMFRLSPAGYQPIDNAAVPRTAEREYDQIEHEIAVRAATEYAPIYALGNLCIGAYFRHSKGPCFD